MTVVAFALCAVAGTLVRALASARDGRTDWPWGMVTVNVVGSFLLGLLADRTDTTVTLLGTGLLGSLTTFSTLMAHVVQRATAGERRHAAAVMAVQLVAGVLAALAGLELA